MKERYLETLTRVIDRIERTLPSSIGLDELSAEACLSKYHLHRVFRALTGFPLAEYARARRLSASLDALLGSDRTVLDIALDFGFSHEQSYIRAFRAQWGMSPGECRERKPLVPVTAPLSPDDLVSVGHDGALACPRLVIRPALHLCGKRQFITDADNEKHDTAAGVAKRFMAETMPTIREPLYQDRYVAYIERCPDPNDNWYMACAELKKSPPRSSPPDGLAYRTIESGRYREFLLVSRVHPAGLLWKDVESLYAAIFGDWMARHPEDESAGWHLEYVDLSVAREDYGEFRVLVPVR